jgi:carbon monoxide dehydrogenase subunit G
VELTHSFIVDRPVDHTWNVVTDLRRAAPCLPGAALLGSDGDEYRGAVTVKVGPITARYEGVARFVERDDTAHRAVMCAEGRDVRGQGSASATIDMRLRSYGTGTEVTVDTDLALAGLVARFGRGVVADVSGKLVRQFAERLEAEVATAEPTAPAVPASAAAAGPAEEAEPLDLGSAGGAALAAALRPQAVPVVAALLGLLLGWLLGRGTAQSDVTKRSWRWSSASPRSTSTAAGCPAAVTTSRWRTRPPRR